MKKFAVLGLLILTHLLSAQTTVNKYQYVLIPAKFDFNKQKDQYRLNTLTKLLLEKYGFTAYLTSDEMPVEVYNSNCNKLFADVEDTGNFINTKLKVVLKDCRGKILYTSKEGTSKDKVYAKAYNEALRDAFESFKELQYHYVPETTTVVAANPVLTTETVILREDFDDNPMLYAQPTTTGFQLVDATPKVVLKLLKTTNPAVFIAMKGTTQGILILKVENWFFEYYQNDQLISEKVNVKF